MSIFQGYHASNSFFEIGISYYLILKRKHKKGGRENEKHR